MVVDFGDFEFECVRNGGLYVFCGEGVVVEVCEWMKGGGGGEEVVGVLFWVGGE